jgi:hypothetical protein
MGMTHDKNMMGGDGVEVIQLLAGLLGHHPANLAAAINSTAEQAIRYSQRNDANPVVAPAPTRFVDMGRHALIKTALGRAYDNYADVLKSDLPPTESLEAAGAMGKLDKEVARLLVYEDTVSPTGLALSACGFGTSNLFESRFTHRGGVILDVAPELHKLLEQTDVGADLPWSQLRLPYPAIYVHLPPPDVPGKTQLAGDDGCRDYEYHDGFYAFEDINQDGQRMITMMLIRNDVGASASGSSTMMGALIENEDDSIQERIEQLIRNHSSANKATEQHVNTSKAVFSYLTKVMLYMSLPDRNAVFVNDRTEALKKTATVPAGLMRKKYQQRAERHYDHIVVGRGIATEAEVGEAQGKGARATHWRRGHFRGQRVGAGRMNIKTVWVRPALIGATHNADAPARKPYKLEV